jgi:hypothetical protein
MAIVGVLAAPSGALSMTSDQSTEQVARCVASFDIDARCAEISTIAVAPASITDRRTPATAHPPDPPASAGSVSACSDEEPKKQAAIAIDAKLACAPLPTEQVLDRVATGGTTEEKTRRSQGAVAEEIAARRAVRELEALALAEQHHRVIADDVAAADGMHADFAARPRADLSRASVDDRAVGVEASAGRFDEASRGAARRIDFLAVVRFDDLDVEGEAESTGRLLDELGQELHAEAHVRGPEHRCSAREIVEGAHRTVVEVRRAAHERDRPRSARPRDRRHRFGMREVDHHLGGFDRRDGIADDAHALDFSADLVASADRADDQEIVLVREAHDGAPHTAARACDGDADLLGGSA